MRETLTYNITIITLTIIPLTANLLSLSLDFNS
jgi:hypothetical protein